jgi:hypothetical protein
MPSEFLYERITKRRPNCKGTLAEPDGTPEPRFALQGTVNWMRGLAIIVADEKISYASMRRFYTGKNIPRNTSRQQQNHLMLRGCYAQTPDIRRWLGERIKSTLSAPSGLLRWTGGTPRNAVVRGTRPLRPKTERDACATGERILSASLAQPLGVCCARKGCGRPYP